MSKNFPTPRSLNSLFGEYGFLGLEECSTPVQHKNGTFMFRDTTFDNHPWKRVYYTFHPVSGYFRRRVEYIKRRYSWARTFDHYQLNRTMKVSRNDRIFTQRIKIYNLALQMTLALNSIKRYQKNID